VTVRGDFAGTDRFAIVRRVGAGGMGVVYEAWDRERELTVAVKCLRHVDPLSLFFFKREFRSLADVSHPNLVVLHELESVGEDWFFSMEYVDGVDFMSWVLGGEEALIPHDHETAETVVSTAETMASKPTRTNLGTDDGFAIAAPALARALSATQMRRLRDALRQLCEGVAALHAAGKLHRDVKPSNALVSRDGRVVLVDFGLVADAEAAEGTRHVVGTPAYMSPEQGAGAPPSHADDWYAVGVVLYECLTGRLPFLGSPMEIVLDKQRLEPPPPSQVVYGVPEDLDILCQALLRRDPSRRPRERDILRAVGAASLDGSTALYSLRAHPTMGVGRESELAELASAFAAMQNGKTLTVRVRGPSGMGKSALVRRFLDELRTGRRAEILSSRCYERESVPYKALDPVMDELARVLATMPREQVQAILPRDVRAVARLFPVLQRVEPIGEAPDVGDAGDLQQLRRRAFDALRALLAGLAALRPLVIHIDDLHWSDLDSAALLDDVLGGPGAPPVLLIVAYRSGSAMPDGLLPSAGEVRTIDVVPLPHDDARKLAERLLGGKSEIAAAIADEAGGNPMFVAELVRAHRDGGGGGKDLEAVLAARIARLPDEARLLLELVAVASGPVPRGVARRASRLERSEYTAAAILGATRLIRSTGARDADTLEVYHDSIRRAVLSYLSGDRTKDHHLALATELSATDVDPERLVFHYRGAGEPAAAIPYAERAAGRADEALAFDRAAELYRLCLDLGAGADDAVTARLLRVRLADALVNSGRARDGATELMTAAEGAPVAVARDLKRRAMEQYLRSGHIEQAMALAREVLGSVGLRLPATAVRALPSLALGRAHLAVRGLRWKRREESAVAPDDLIRVDIARSVAQVLGLLDTVRGAEFQTRSLRLALDCGEPRRVASALATEASYMATRSSAGRQKAEEVLNRAREALTGIDDPWTRAQLDFGAGMIAFFDGRWRDSLAAFDAAEVQFTERCRGVIWELNTTRSFSLWCMGYLGRLDELAARAQRYVRDARERGDRYALCALVGAMPNLAWLVRDDVDGSRSLMDEAMRQWPSQGFYIQHYYELMAGTHADLYCGDGKSAWARMAKRWPDAQRSLLLQVQQIRLELTFCRARAALAAAAAGERGLLDVALADASRLDGEDARRGPATADLVRAGAALVVGDRELAATTLERAGHRFDAMDMLFHAAVARRGIGLATGNRDRVDEAEAWLRTLGVPEPARLCGIFLPIGLPAAGEGVA
jgi:serine/threonine protein kinase/tetratricopeptide (TPR) repeat protein